MVGSVDVISARALAPLEALLPLSVPYFGPNTMAVFAKGRDYQAEIEAARQTWTFDLALTASQTDPEAQILTVSGVAAKA